MACWASACCCCAAVTCPRRRAPGPIKTLKWVFWLFNGGLALMVFGSLLPQGIIQTLVSFDQGYWYARSPELLHSPLMEALVWLRVPGDVVFAAGAVLLLVFLVRLELGRQS